MTPERWQRIDKLFQSALDLEPIKRSSFIKEACGDDDSLRSEVESLIAAHEHTGEFLDAPAYGVAESFSDDSINVAIGETLGNYKVLSHIRSGGMGHVYLARHTTLGGKVALKLLPTDFAKDEQRIRRFQQEARAASALNHPCVCVIHEISKTADGRHFIAMEYIDGITLRERIAHKRLRLSEALGITEQIAFALQAAHAAGIIHRDIKPENVMIHRDGYVKVLDFGLAKLVEDRIVSGDIHDALTVPRAQSEGGRIGTVRYMSPEQLRELPIDERTDIWSLGIVLHEMVTGVTPFEAQSTAESISMILQEGPPILAFSDRVPGELRRIVARTLCRNREERYQTINELLIDLRKVRRELRGQNELASPAQISMQLDGAGESVNITEPLEPRPDTARTSIIDWVRSQAASTLTTLFTDTLRQPSVFISATGVALIAGLVVYFVLIPRLFIHRPSKDAMRWYDVGTTALRNGAYFEASKALRQAVTNDDKFALAHARLAEAYTELDYSDKAKDEIIRAESLARELWLPQSDSLYLKAITNTVLRDFPPVIESYQQIARQASDQEKANVYLDLGRAYEKNDELEKAKENYQEATRLAPQEAPAFLRLGIVCGELQDHACAAEAFQKAESLYQALSNLEGVTEVFCQQGFLFIYHEIKPPEAKAQLEKALEMTKATGNQFQLIRVLLALSRVSELEGHITEAEQQATEAIQVARDNGIENQATGGLIWLGNTFLLRGDYDQAERYYQQALQLAQRDKMLFNEAWALTELGSLRSMQRKTEEVLRYIEKPLAFYKQGGYRKLLSWILILQGRAHRDKGDYEAALSSFNELHQLGEQLGDQAQMGLADLDIGNVLSREEQYTEALRHFDDGHKIFESLKVDVYMAYAAQNRASVLWQLGRSEEAKAALDEATSIAGQSYKSLLADVHLTRSLLELSDWQIQNAKIDSQKALDLAGTQSPDIAVQVYSTLALAQARSGAARAGTLAGDKAVEIANGTNDPQLLSGALLASAEATLADRDARRALEIALSVQQTFARFGKQDSEWRAWLIAALASSRLGNETAAHEYSSKAVSQLSSLEQKWGAEACSGYLARSDIVRFRRQLDELLKP